MQALLSYDNAPPFAAPLRFFLTAPLFMMLAGLLVAVSGPDIFASRWMPATLAATHLLTVGFMLQIMLGAMIQILPVVAGANMRRPLLVARIVHPCLTAGTLLLAGGFLLGRPLLLTAGAIMLLAGVSVFLAAALGALLGVPSTSPTIRGLKLALLGLLGVVALGILLVTVLAQGWSMPLMEIADLHAGWGFAGWGGVLLAATAYVVVPMFQLTPGYPARPSWWFPLVVLGLLLVWSLGLSIGWPVLLRGAQGALALVGIAFAGLTLRLQLQRRRARADATSRYWKLGLIASILALAMLLTAAIRPEVSGWPAWTPLFGILLVVGGFQSFIVGMLYKIVPFLSWLHLQNRGRQKVSAPAMNRILSDLEMQRQMQAHAVAGGLLLAAALFPDYLARAAGIALAVAGGWLWWNLLSAARRYRRFVGEIDGKLEVR